MPKSIILVCAILTVLSLAVYKATFNDDGYQILLKNRKTQLGYGINICSKVDCMPDHKSKFEVWRFAKTERGGIAENRIYPRRKSGEEFLAEIDMNKRELWR